MRCFTYSKGKVSTGIVQNEFKNNKTLNTCAILLKVPDVWPVDALIENIRSRAYADILLHTCIELVEGDSVSNVFPETCAVVRFPCPVSFTNYNNSALELDVSADGVLAVLFTDSCVYDKDTGKYVTNVDGNIAVSDKEPESQPTVGLEPGFTYVEL